MIIIMIIKIMGLSITGPRQYLSSVSIWIVSLVIKISELKTRGRRRKKKNNSNNSSSNYNENEEEEEDEKAT